MLMRYYDVQQGKVMLDGCEIRQLDPRWMRQRMALVSQEPVLFGASIKENIMYGHLARVGVDGAPLDQKTIEKVADMANASSFINAFPEGYDTLVGERGIKLSGGQKQRVAIARALLQNPR